MKNIFKNKTPFVGFYFYVASLIVLIIAYVIAISTFNAYGLPPDRFVIVFPIFAMWIIFAQILMSFVDENKPIWFNATDILFCFFVVFTFGRLLIPFLTAIGIYFTVNMGDMETFAIVVPRCITGCAMLVASCVLFIAGSFFKIVKIKEAK